MEDVADLFDDWAGRGRAEGMETGHAQTAGHVVASLPLGPGKRLLDVGCGNGWACRQAAATGASAVGVDVSPAMVARATEAAAAAGHADACTFQVADAADLPFDDDAFDAAWSMEALYYAPDPDRVLAQIRRVLRPGAPFHMVIDHYEENAASHSWPDDVGVAMVLRSEAAWLTAFAAAGFESVEASRLRAAPAAGVDDWKVEQGSLHVTGRA